MVDFTLPTNEQIADFNQALVDKQPLAILNHALKVTDGQIALAFSGAEDVVLIDMLSKTGKTYQVFTLDTGRLHPETYEFIQKVNDTYNIHIELMFPEHDKVEAFVKEKGLFSFYQDDHAQCCGIRKVAPLRRKLATLDGWISGQRKDQSVSRVELDVVQIDTSFEGRCKQPLIKYNPLANWTSEQVWKYIVDNNVPYNPLHDQGFKSIGCAPCTKAISPGQHEREGRWWWEESTKKECGLHLSNLNKSE